LWAAIGHKLAEREFDKRSRGRSPVWNLKRRAELLVDLLKMHKDWSEPPSASILARRLCGRMPEKYGNYAKTATKLKSFEEKHVLPMKRLAAQLVKAASGK
jgi:hypothetical protein